MAFEFMKVVSCLLLVGKVLAIQYVTVSQFYIWLIVWNAEFQPRLCDSLSTILVKHLFQMQYNERSADLTSFYLLYIYFFWKEATVFNIK